MKPGKDSWLPGFSSIKGFSYSSESRSLQLNFRRAAQLKTWPYRAERQYDNREILAFFGLSTTRAKLLRVRLQMRPHFY